MSREKQYCEICGRPLSDVPIHNPHTGEMKRWGKAPCGYCTCKKAEGEKSENAVKLEPRLVPLTMP